MKVKINFAIKSRKGKRKVNQDGCVASYNKNGDFIAIVCDGVGSVKGSEVASKVVCQTFASLFEKAEKMDKPITWAKRTLSLALTKLSYVSKANFLPNIATTLAMLIIANNKYYAFNIGDTRIYGIKDQVVKQITTDHNYLNYLLKIKADKKLMQVNRSKWGCLTNYIEPEKEKKAVFNTVIGDSIDFRYFLICTDGLYDFVKPEVMSSTVNKKWLPLVFRSSLLNSKALSNNSTDNISNILVSCNTKL